MIKILRLFDENDVMKIEKSCKILGIEPNPKILDEILKYMLETSNSSNGERIFDYDLDFKYYYADFKALGIDLIEQDLDWFKFNSVLKKVLMSDDTLMAKIISYRTYKKPEGNAKTIANKRHQEMNKLKREYALPQRVEHKENNINKMWNFLERS